MKRLLYIGLIFALCIGQPFVYLPASAKSWQMASENAGNPWLPWPSSGEEDDPDEVEPWGEESEEAGSEEEKTGEDEPESEKFGEDEPEGEEPDRDDNRADDHVLLIGFIAAGCIIAILVAIILILTTGRKKHSARGKTKPLSPKPPKNVAGGMPLHVEVLSGHYMVTAYDYTFTDELLIGSGRQCDIVFADGDVADPHARIQRNNGQLYLVDLSGPFGTYLEDMRIQDMNLLENGDTVMVGSAEFRVYF